MTSSLAAAKTSHFCSNQRLGWGEPREKVPCGKKNKVPRGTREKRRPLKVGTKWANLSSLAWGLKESRNGDSELSELSEFR